MLVELQQLLLRFRMRFGVRPDLRLNLMRGLRLCLGGMRLRLVLRCLSLCQLVYVVGMLETRIPPGDVFEFDESGTRVEGGRGREEGHGRRKKVDSTRLAVKKVA